MFLRTILDVSRQRDRSDNPTAYEFGNNDLTIGIERVIAPVVRGNVGGHYEKKWFTVSDEQVNKYKKMKK